MWRTLIYVEIAKQQAKRGQTHPVCLNAVEKYKKVESVNTQNDYEKKVNVHKNKLVLCTVSFLKAQDCSKEFLGNTI